MIFLLLDRSGKKEVETSKIISDLNQKISLNNSLFEIIEKLGVIAKDSYSAFSIGEIFVF